jgi:hypothetical protein
MKTTADRRQPTAAKKRQSVVGKLRLLGRPSILEEKTRC